MPGPYLADVSTNPVTLYRPTMGTCFFLSGPSPPVGDNGDIPVPADYNGGRLRPSNGYWFVKDGPTVQFGANGDIPLSRPLGPS